MTKHTHSGVAKATPIIARLLRDERGTAAIEYGLMAALIAVAAIQALSSLGSTNSETFNAVDEAMAGEGAGPAQPPSPDGPWV